MVLLSIKFLVNFLLLIILLSSRILCKKISIKVTNFEINSKIAANDKRINLQLKFEEKFHRTLRIDEKTEPMKFTFEICNKSGHKLASQIAQAFIAFKHIKTGAEIIFITKWEKNSNVYFFKMDPKKLAAKFKNLGKYNLQLIIGDPLALNQINWNLIDVFVDIPRKTKKEITKSEKGKLDHHFKKVEACDDNIFLTPYFFAVYVLIAFTLHLWNCLKIISNVTSDASYQLLVEKAVNRNALFTNTFVFTMFFLFAGYIVSWIYRDIFIGVLWALIVSTPMLFFWNLTNLSTKNELEVNAIVNEELSDGSISGCESMTPETEIDVTVSSGRSVDPIGTEELLLLSLQISRLPEHMINNLVENILNMDNAQSVIKDIRESGILNIGNLDGQTIRELQLRMS